MKTKTTKPHSVKLKLGRIVATPGALESINDACDSIHLLLALHMHGKWGDVSAADAATNDRAVRDGGRALSAYTLASGVRIWIITEADRSCTTVLLPTEY